MFLLGNKIQALRKEKSITLETLASELGVTAGAVSKWEHNNSLPDITMLCNIADYFNISTDELLGRKGKITFAICDDSSFIRESVKNVLENNNYICKGLFASCHESLKFLENSSVDVFIIDIHLTNGNHKDIINESGLDILKKIKTDYKDVKTVILTGDTSKSVKNEAESIGCDSFINKPFLPDDLLSALSSL